MSYGEDAVKRAIARELRAVFPGIKSVDFEVVAAKLMEAVDIAAVRKVNDAQTRLHKALSGLMEQNADLVQSLNDRIASLEAERSELHLALAKHQNDEVPASLPQETPTEDEQQ